MPSHSIKITPPVIGHRGAAGHAPENTAASFLKAKALGVKWVEFDVQLTADEELIVFHDATLDRTTNGKGFVRDYPLEYLKTLDAGSWFHPEFQNEKILTLLELLQFLQKNQLAANLEVKVSGGEEEIITNKIASLLSSQLRKQAIPILIASFSVTVLSHIKQLTPQFPLCFLLHVWNANWQSIVDELGCVGIGLNRDIIDEEKIASMLTGHRSLLTSYTVNDPLDAARLFSWGVSAIISDYPDKMLEIRNSR